MISNTITAIRIVLLIPLYYFLSRGPADAGWLALATFLLAGLTDVIDGRVARRLGEVSAFGAMLDLIGDQLLTLTTLLGLMASGAVAGPLIIAGLVLIARTVIVASLNEALPGRLNIKVSPMEKAKIAFNFLGFGLLMAPDIGLAIPAFGPGFGQHALGAACLWLSAALTVFNLSDYALRAHRAFAEDRRKSAEQAPTSSR